MGQLLDLETRHPAVAVAGSQDYRCCVVAGTNVTLGMGFITTRTRLRATAANANILFNFADAQSVNINGQFNASILDITGNFNFRWP